ncbi:Maf-like protein YhdE [Rosistilla carotiformis]|uniref:dTTP/UTP pyrophosphatase n=1 Tax=Rosistilla carotiformis TaxID=2528017 RepID=A0A518JV70_9BACT|nr:Maf family protein [Rosistilla carotiformis]QDV69442.1 Maf-like protein YhdE [Rosistilla carotiformis]
MTDNALPQPEGLPIVLASGSPRRRELMQQAGYSFDVIAPDPAVECGVCSSESPAELVGRLAFRKAEDVMRRIDSGMIIAADTVAACRGQILGKPVDRDHARQMLTMLAGTDHAVYTGICLWSVPDQKACLDVCCTQLKMEAIDDATIEAYLDSERWVGKAGAFGYQDGNDWLQILSGSASNVVGLPMERLHEMLSRFSETAQPIDVSASPPPIVRIDRPTS